MKTWFEIIEAKDRFRKAIADDNDDTPEWFRGVGVGFDIYMAGSYTLVVNVREDKDIAAAEDAIERIKFDGPVEIKVVGDIVAL